MIIFVPKKKFYGNCLGVLLETEIVKDFGAILELMVFNEAAFKILRK